jgi:hypothetical protein
MERNHIRDKKIHGSTSRRRDSVLIEMHKLSASHLRSATLFRMLELVEEEEEEEPDTPAEQDEDLNTFGSKSKRFSRVIFARDSKTWILAPQDYKCKIHPWLVSSEITRLLVNTVAEDGVHNNLVARMTNPRRYDLEISFVQGMSLTPSRSGGMDPFQVYATM